MKICTKCQKNDRAEGQGWCKECFLAYNREWRSKNKERASQNNRRSYLKHHDRRLVDAARYRESNKDQIKIKTESLKDQKRELVRAAKDVPCADCGQKFPSVAMDFDHVRGVKKYNISHMAGGSHSIKALQEEIAKCEICCANCHRIRTAQRRSS